ncbi:MAG: response regulator [Hydrogenophaga sp.]|uniref:response regulator n=1 Tax=Hydrogenophaga sp. TaxID=1904254 RepID=UPI001D41FAE6|nr:response regulator [Hydrogenophaga sp.]MBX3611406.1 response regulator [Hydrogenophaga sp.]
MKPTNKHATNRPKVLCVDDEPGLLRSLRWLLRDQFDVAVTDNPATGLALLAADRFDVVISDQRMPGMSGTEFLERARHIAPTCVRLLLTGYSDFGAVLASVNEAEVFRFITKPWDNQRLLHTVGEASRLARLNADTGTGFEETAILDDDDTPVQATLLLFDAEPELADKVTAAAPEGSRFVSTHDVGDALGLMAREQVAVLVADLSVHREQQITFIASVRKSRPDVVVVVLSAARDIKLMARLINEGQIYRFLARPVAPQQMRQALRQAINRHQAICRRAQATTASAADTVVDSDFELDFSQTTSIQRLRTALPTANRNEAGQRGALRAWVHRVVARWLAHRRR